MARLDLARVATVRVRIKTILLGFAVAAYVCFSLYLFFQWVAPSLEGRADQRIAADSSTYIHFADQLRSGDPDPPTVIALSSFPNTLWMPVFMAFELKTTFDMVVANYAIFLLAFCLLRRSLPLSAGTFLGLLVLNATTTISLLSVNKEIVDLLAVALFVYGRRKGNYFVLLLSVIVAFFNRYEVCLVLLLYLFAESPLDPLRRTRGRAILVILAVLSLLLPVVAAHQLATHLEEASRSNTITFLDNFEMHFMYALVVIPKVAENFFSELIDVSKWIHSYSFSDLANSYILLSNNFANLVVVALLLRRRAFTFKSDLIYLATIGAIIMGISLVVQPRYFYCVYVVLCLKASLPKTLPKPGTSELSSPHRGIGYA
ncbi:MAG: hypothetical protein ACLGQX_03710 [Acidobacteriota bacterium]